MDLGKELFALRLELMGREVMFWFGFVSLYQQEQRGEAVSQRLDS